MSQHHIPRAKVTINLVTVAKAVIRLIRLYRRYRRYRTYLRLKEAHPVKTFTIDL